MEFLQNIDGGTASLVLVGLCALCLIGVVLFFGAQILGAVVGTFGDIFGFALELISGGPLQWCGCLLAIGGCAVVGIIVWLVAGALSSCGTQPTNFCALFGR
jgi:hypothetical protein